MAPIGAILNLLLPPPAPAIRWEAVGGYVFDRVEKVKDDIKFVIVIVILVDNTILREKIGLKTTTN